MSYAVGWDKDCGTTNVSCWRERMNEFTVSKFRRSFAVMEAARIKGSLADASEIGSDNADVEESQRIPWLHQRIQGVPGW